MPKIPYFQDDTRPDVADLVKTIQSRRPNGQLIALDRMLLNSPAFARGWNTMLGAVRKDLSLSLKHREMIICAVAILNDAPYQWDQHLPEWLSAGATDAQVAELARGVLEAFEGNLFDPTEEALLRLTLEITRNIKVSPPTFDQLKRLISNEQIVEAVGVIATYNMVSRFLVALEVE